MSRVPSCSFVTNPPETGRGKNLRAAAAKLDTIVQDKKILLSDHAVVAKKQERGVMLEIETHTWGRGGLQEK